MAMQQPSSGMDDSNAKVQQCKGKKNHQNEDTGKVKTTEKLVGHRQKRVIAPIMKLFKWHPTENIQEEATIGSNNDSYPYASDALQSMKPSTSNPDKSSKTPKRKGREKGQRDKGQSDRLNDPKSASASSEIHLGGSNLGYEDDTHPLNDAGPSTSIPDTRMDVLKATVRKLRKKFSRKDEELKRVRKEHDASKADLDAISSRYEEELQILSRKVKQLEKEKNELLIRISSYAAAKLTNENPRITDLSDQNRPDKISERYSELYDNHWTDAFQNLQQKHHMSEINAIEFLLKVLYVSFSKCKEARLTKENAIQALNEYIGADGDDPQDMTVLEVMKTLKDTKKRNIKRMQNVYLKSVMETLTGMTKDTPQILQDVEPYLDECVELCFLMNIQEPPLELRGLICSSCTPFDASAFQPYTKSGKKIDYIVWPAMHLYRDGPILCKGIAQGKPGPSDVHRPRSINVKDRQTEHIRERTFCHQSQKNITEKSKCQYYKPGISILTNVFCMENNMPSSKTKSNHSVFTEEKEVENSQTDSSESC